MEKELELKALIIETMKKSTTSTKLFYDTFESVCLDVTRKTNTLYVSKRIVYPGSLQLLLIPAR